MIIKTRLARDSPYYRLTCVDQGADLSAVISEVIDQWELPKTSIYALLTLDHLIIDKSKEWQVYSSLNKEKELHDFVIVNLKHLQAALPSQSFTSPPIDDHLEVKADDRLSVNQVTTSLQPKHGFLSVDPQPLGPKKTYPRYMEEEAKTRAAPVPAVMSSTPEQSSFLTQEEGIEDTSTYARVMARSRMQGEGLNKLFGTIMAKRAGHSEGLPESEAEANAPALIVGNDANEIATTSKMINPKVHERNAWMKSAWEQRLREMGHRSSSGNLYAPQGSSKGKSRDIVPEASITQVSPLVERSISEGGKDNVSPLRPLSNQRSSLLTPSSENSPTLSYSLPGSRPGSASGFSSNGRSNRLNFARLLGKGNRNRKRQGSAFPFASQPPSLYSSGTLTPDESAADSGNVRRRRKAFSLRSLSDALLKDKYKSSQIRSREGSLHSHQQGDSTSINGQPAGEATINEESRSQSSSGEGEREANTVQKKQEEISRPTLLRASQSVPLSSTAINLSSVDGITLHVSIVGATLFAQQQEEIVKRNLFDLMLPREIRITCFKWLVKIHEEADIDDLPKQGIEKRQAAAREILRLSLVSKTWQSLLLDGQLWSNVDSFLLSNMSNAGLLRLTRAAGPFIKRLDLRHANYISSSLLISMMSVPEEARKDEAQRFKSMMSVPTLSSIKTVQLTSLSVLNISGCRNISRIALHGALVRLPSLTNLDVSNSDVVCEDTCLILGSSHPNLVSLSVSRCFNLSGKGITAFIQAAQGSLYDKALFSTSTDMAQREEDITLPLQTLRIAGCLGIDAMVTSLMGKALQSLQVLDVSYASDLSDAAIGALVAHPGPLQVSHNGDLLTKGNHYHQMKSDCDVSLGPFVTLSPRQAGGDIQTDEVHYRRVFTSLRHICLSSCRRLTDRSCSYLAHAVPTLQYFEMANIGVNLREDGIKRLLQTTPQIQRVDLEGASEVGDGVLDTLTPDASYTEALGMEMSRRGRRLSRRRSRQDGNQSSSMSQGGSIKQRKASPPGARLTHLILSHMTKISQESLLLLIRRCPRLIHLQLDDTKANDAVLKEFVAICRLRESRNTYVSLVDCRALSRTANADVTSQSITRPREGKRGREYHALEYSDGATAVTRNGNSDQYNVPIDECNDRLIVVKTFFNWEIRSQQRRVQQRRNQKAIMTANDTNGGRFMNRGRRDSLGAALAFIGGVSGHQSDEDTGTGRWGRIAGNLMGQGDEAEDSRACTIM